MLIRSRYRVVERLGAGAMGTVYAVDDVVVGARVALKALWPDAGDAEVAASLRSEFGVLAALRHPLLCRVHDFGRLPPGLALEGAPERAAVAGGLFYTRELVAGVDLAAAAVEAGRAVAPLCRWLAAAARGLDVLHRAGLRHGDFKPRNAIVLGDDVRLIDFGLAGGERSIRSAGTLAYMAPEILARRRVDRRADLYALGVALFEVVAGELPSGAGAANLAAWHLQRERPALRERRRGVPAALDDLASRLIAFDPDDRPPSASEAAAALDAVAEAARPRRARAAAAAAVTDEAPLLAPVGQAQVAALERAFERRQAGQGGPALIELVGAVGCGKSTILTELAWRAQLAGAEVVRGQPEARGHALGALGAALAQLDALSPGAAPPPPGGDLGDGTRGPGHVALAIAAALADAARRFPLLVLLDDLDFADEGSRALAPAVALALPERAQVLLVATRTAAPGRSMESIGRDDQPDVVGPGAPDDGSGPARDVEQLHVPPLTAAEVAELVERAAGRADRRLGAWVHQHTGGNLLHLVHTVGALAARGFPVVDKLATLALPPRIEEWERAALAAVSPEERAVCEALAVLGAPAAPALVAAVADLDPADARAALERAGRRGLLRADAGDRVRPARAATAQALEASLDPARRAAMHRRAAAALADEAAPEAERDAGAVLWHLVRGGERDAVRAAIAPALRRLRAAGDHAGALALGGAALELVPGDDALRLEVGELASLTGDLPRADTVLAPLVAGGGPRRPRAQLALARACDAGGETERAEQLYRAVLAGAPPASDTAVWAARDLAAHYIRGARTADALAVAEAALAHDVPAAMRGHLLAARAYARGAGDAAAAGAAIAELEEVGRAAEQAGDRAMVAAALHHAARLAFSGGDYRRAQAGYQAALAAAEATGEAARIATLRMNLAAMAFSFGDFGRSYEHYVAALSLFRATGLRSGEVLARRNMGHLLIELGEVEQARVHLAAAAREAARAGQVLHEIGVEALLGIADWRAGDLDGARRRLVAARERFAALPDARREAETLLDLADLELAAARDDGAREDAAAAHLAAAAALPATREDTARRARHAALAAQLAARRGDAASARAHLAALEDALAEVTAQGGRQLEWELHRIAAAAAEALGDAALAARHRGRALALLDRIAAGLPDSLRLSFWHDPRRRELRRARPSVGATEIGSTILGGSSGSDRMVDTLFRLLEVYRRLSTERDAARLLELAMDTAIELSGCERGFLLLARPGRSRAPIGRDDQPGLVGLPDGALETAVARNLPPAELAGMAAADSDPAPDPASVPYSRSIAERVYLTGEPVLTTDAQIDPRFLRAESVLALHIRRVLCIPIHAHGRAAGVLYLEAKVAARAIADDDLRLLRAFGDQVAVVLDSARLVAENVRRADELEAARREIEQLLAERTELLEQRTEELASARRDLESVHRRFLGARGAFGLVGRSAAMERVFEVIDRAAATDVVVLVLGESGTGKELVARALHQYGRRRGAPLVSLNCGALPEGLLESELFGHVRGAFTGADRSRRGLFEAADGGTLFLDEIGDTPARMQAALLRAVQEGVVRPVGGTRDVTVDVRLVAATHRPLEELVAAGRFREDLFYRLNVLSIELPPLRGRREDIPLLVEHFLVAIAGRTGGQRRTLTRRALKALADHPWPGNVRQLEHALTQASVMTSGKVIDLEDLAEALRGGGARRGSGKQSVADRRAREKQRILDALEAHGWNRSKAAEALGMPRRTFYRRLGDHDIQ